MVWFIKLPQGSSTDALKFSLNCFLLKWSKLTHYFYFDSRSAKVSFIFGRLGLEPRVKMNPTLLTACLSFLLLSITTVSSPTVIRESCQNDVAAFVNHLALQGNLTTKVVETATRRKCFNTTLSTETDRAKLACHISSMVFRSDYLDASSADYKNRTEVNWYGCFHRCSWTG